MWHGLFQGLFLANRISRKVTAMSKGQMRRDLVFDTDIVSAQAAYTVTKNAGVEIETGSFVRYLRGIALKAYPVTSPPWRYCVIGPFRRTDYGVRRQFLPLRYTLARIPFPTKHDKG